MKPTFNKQRLNNLLKGMQKSIDLFQKQGYQDVYFTAQFMRGGKKQNGIERGDVSAFASQIRTYVGSEEADAVRIEFIDDSTGKSIYSKVLTELRHNEVIENAARQNENQTGLGAYQGLGEAQVNAIVDKRVNEARFQDEFQRISKELDVLRNEHASLEHQKVELEEELKAKKNTEYYMGIIGAALPGLAPLFTGTPLAQAASFLAGTSDLSGQALPAPKENSDTETMSIAAMVSEFCQTLNHQEIHAVQLLFMAFEKDKNLIHQALHSITVQTQSS